MRRGLGVAAAVLLGAALSGCGAATPAAPVTTAPITLPPSARASQNGSASPAEAGSLAQPIHLPVMKPGAACPHSAARQLVAGLGPALGGGPVTPTGIGNRGVVSTGALGGYWVQNVAWISSPSYGGSAVVRGRQLNGSGPISFGVGVVANAPELDLPASGAVRLSRAKGWRQWNSVVAVNRSGCYGFQIDGDGFSRIVVFEVR